ncbi:MAG: peptidoglycan-binding domain-containing protein [Minisyncoccia bacterium]
MNNENEENKEVYQGAILDTRTQEAKDKDYHFGEIVVSADPVNWIIKPRNEWRKFPIFDQDGGGSCVAQTMAKLLGIMYFLLNGIYVHFSATHIFQRRINKPQSGMGGDDVFRIGSEGVTLEELVPSQGMTDAQMDAVVIPQYKQDVGKIFKIAKNWVILPIKDIETIASVIQKTGKGVMTWTFWNYDEWGPVPKVLRELDLYGVSTSRHSTAQVDFTLIDKTNLPEHPEAWGKKALIMDESWNKSAGLDGQRVITEDFFKVRNFFAAYPVNFVFEDGQNIPDATKPIFTFTKQLSFIPWDMIKNRPVDIVKNQYQKEETIQLQNVLKYEGLFAKNIDSTGYFGAVTKKAVMDFQMKYGIEVVGEVGPKTRLKLNKLYGQ